MTPEQAIAGLQERVQNADADELIAALASISPARPDLNEHSRRCLVRILAQRLAIRVLSPDFMEIKL